MPTKNPPIEIVYGLIPSPFGTCVVGIIDRHVCSLTFMDGDSERIAKRNIKESWPGAILRRDDALVHPYRKRIFGSTSARAAIPVRIEGTDFQTKVWKALQDIPEGKTVRYADIARRIGSPKAFRAIGTACGKNPIGLIIPCHRVLPSNGGLGGYHWGPTRKQAILTWESVRSGRS